MQKITLPAAIEAEDEDVTRERIRVEQDTEMNDELRLLQLTKVHIFLYLHF